MPKKDRIPEEIKRRAKIRELLQMSNISSMDDIQNLFKETSKELHQAEQDKEEMVSIWPITGLSKVVAGKRPASARRAPAVC